MRKVMIAVLTATFIIALSYSGRAAETAEGSTYYTRVGFYHEKGTHKTTNYLRGIYVPVNTEVEVLKERNKYITIRVVDTGAQVKIENVKNYSGEDIDGIFERMFGHEATDLSAYPPEHVKYITSGVFEPGMTKEEIILSIGYPPKHKTPSLESNQWRYWKGRFDTVLIYFKDDVMEGMLD